MFSPRSKAVALVLATALLAACEQAPDSSVTAVEEPPAEVMQSLTYGASPLRNDWPGSVASAVTVDRLLAKNFYLVVDGSGSMSSTSCAQGSTRIDVAKQAVLQFIDRLPEDSNMGVYVFDSEGAAERVALGAGRKGQVKEVVSGMRHGGGTPLSKAINAGFSALTKQAEVQLGYGEYHLVVVTDGEAKANYDPTAEIDRLLAASPIEVHTVGFCIDSGHSLNRPGFTHYAAASDGESLLRGLESVLAEAPDFSSMEWSQ